VHAFPDNCRSKMLIDEAALFECKFFWFTPWVAHCGDWNYQQSRDQRRYRFESIPYKLDVLVHHMPAQGVGDLTYSCESVGCLELRAAIQKKQPRHSVFGHIHEGLRHGQEYRLGGTVMHHASMWGDKWKPVTFDIK
jgi:hypothetical protein